MSLLEVKELKKVYGQNEAVKSISFEVKEKEILGFLGPNGAGKSTTINILSTALKSTSGSIKFKGKDINQYRNDYKSEIGVVPQNLAIFENISAVENVKYLAGFYGLKGSELNIKSKQALEMVGLLERANDLPKTFSGGMKRRLNIACALAHSPKLLILDEPTVGIDPQSRNNILESIKKLRENGMTIIYTTHYMEEVEAISDRVLIIDKGEIISEGTLEELKSKIKDKTIYNIYADGLESINLNDIKNICGVKEVELNDKLRISVSEEINNLDKIILYLIKNGIKIKNINTDEENLETIFLNLTGRSLRD